MLLHFAIVGWVVTAGLPVSFSWNVLVNVLLFHPLLFGILLFVAKRRGNKGFSLKGVVVYQATLAIRKQVMWTLVILLLTAPIWFLLAPLAQYLQPFFQWVPQTDQGYDGEFPTSIIATTFALNVILTGIVTPIAEELYYRGYLLPRMPTVFGAAGPVVHSFLFALHHFHSPWMIVSRTFGLLPTIYVTRYIGSVVPGIIAHAFVNSYSLFEWAMKRWE